MREPDVIVIGAGTACTFDPPADSDRRSLVCDVDAQFYVKPSVGRLLGSPADETPAPPCDARAALAPTRFTAAS